MVPAVGSGVPRNLGQFERRRVGDAVMAGGVSQPHRIVGRDRIEIGGGDVAPFGELALVPAGAATHSPGLTRAILAFTRATISATEAASESFIP